MSMTPIPQQVAPTISDVAKIHKRLQDPRSGHTLARQRRMDLNRRKEQVVIIRGAAGSRHAL